LHPLVLVRRIVPHPRLAHLQDSGTGPHLAPSGASAERPSERPAPAGCGLQTAPGTRHPANVQPIARSSISSEAFDRGHRDADRPPGPVRFSGSSITASLLPIPRLAAYWRVIKAAASVSFGAAPFCGTGNISSPAGPLTKKFPKSSRKTCASVQIQACFCKYLQMALCPLELRQKLGFHEKNGKKHACPSQIDTLGVTGSSPVAPIHFRWSQPDRSAAGQSNMTK
jgi:hypothetical protein